MAKKIKISFFILGCRLKNRMALSKILKTGLVYKVIYQGWEFIDMDYSPIWGERQTFRKAEIYRTDPVISICIKFI